jgi:hypothetical protein
MSSTALTSKKRHKKFYVVACLVDDLSPLSTFPVQPVSVISTPVKKKQA